MTEQEKHLLLQPENIHMLQVHREDAGTGSDDASASRHVLSCRPCAIAAVNETVVAFRVALMGTVAGLWGGFIGWRRPCSCSKDAD